MALLMGFRPSVSLQSAIQATKLLALTLIGLTPAEHASICWTHSETLYKGMTITYLHDRRKAFEDYLRAKRKLEMKLKEIDR